MARFTLAVRTIELAGYVLDGSTVPVTAGADELITGDRVGTTNIQPTEDAVVH